MRAILEFDLPEDTSEWHAASDGLDWALVVRDLDLQCREWIKHDQEFADPVHAFQGVRKFILDRMEDKSLKFPEPDNLTSK
jgi:hypothetical protein